MQVFKVSVCMLMYSCKGDLKILKQCTVQAHSEVMDGEMTTSFKKIKREANGIPGCIWCLAEEGEG